MAASDHIGATGDCSDASRVVVQGEAIPCGDACAGAGDYNVWRANFGRTAIAAGDQGALLLLKHLGGPTELAAGEWEGDAFDDEGNRAGRVTAAFTAGRGGTGSNGVVNFLSADDDSPFDVVLDLTVPADPLSPYGFALVGGGSDGLLFVTGKLMPRAAESPARIEGTLTLMAEESEPLTVTITLRQLAEGS